jgi:hypothetical protein
MGVMDSPESITRIDERMLEERTAIQAFTASADCPLCDAWVYTLVPIDGESIETCANGHKISFAFTSNGIIAKEASM